MIPDSLGAIRLLWPVEIFDDFFPSPFIPADLNQSFDLGVKRSVFEKGLPIPTL